MTALRVDVLVVGGGMAGMTAGAAAARAGRTVVVVESGPQIGGSAVLSGGLLWAPASVDVWAEVNPSGDPARGRALVEGFAEAVEFVRSMDVEVSEMRSLDELQNFSSVGCVVDIFGYVQRCRATIEQADGWVICGARVERLVTRDGAVVGAVVADRDGEVEVEADAVVLATGGFQCDRALRDDLIGAHAADLWVRSNPNSDGGGLRLARGAGGRLSPPTKAFYGHLMASPLEQPMRPGDYVRLAQIYSPRALLFDEDGQRVGDESFSYYKNAQLASTCRSGRALLVGDERVKREDAMIYGPGYEVIDRPKEAAVEGARVVDGASAAELDAAVEPWGFAGIGAGVERFNADVAGGTPLPPRRRHARTFEPPYFGIEVRPAITFPFRGIDVDVDGRVVGEHGAAVPGLLAAGADTGGIYEEAYGGGLSLAAVFGLRAIGAAAP